MQSERIELTLRQPTRCHIGVHVIGEHAKLGGGAQHSSNVQIPLHTIWVEFQPKFFFPLFEFRPHAVVKNCFQFVDARDERLWSIIIEFFILGAIRVDQAPVNKLSATIFNIFEGWIRMRTARAL